jgi:hypothetical protein
MAVVALATFGCSQLDGSAPLHDAGGRPDPPKTPIDRFFGFVGKQDVEYGDIQFTMERMKYVGKPVNVTTAKAPYGGTHRFYADAGHDGFDSAPYYDALNIARGVAPENAAWALTH